MRSTTRTLSAILTIVWVDRLSLVRLANNVSHVDIFWPAFYNSLASSKGRGRQVISEKKLYAALGAKLRDLRESGNGGRARFTQGELADLVGLKRTSITNIEKGNQTVSLHVLYRLCEVLKADVTAVLPKMTDVQLSTTENVEMQFGGTVHHLSPKAAEFLSTLVSSGGSK